MSTLVYSSECYLIKAADLKKERQCTDITVSSFDGVTLLLDNDDGNAIVGGSSLVAEAQENDFLPVRIAYRSFPAWAGFLINLIKPIKRKFYQRNSASYTTTLSCLLENDLLRGMRNEENAYQWTNKKWQISREEAHQRYTTLFNSIKENGYDAKQPMFVMLNRKFGVKDQILQGHHRIGICQALQVEQVNIAFWAAPKSFDFFKLFTRRKR